MPLRAVFVSGPPHGGKTTLVRLLARDVLRRPPHYVRLYGTASGEGPDLRVADDEADEAMASVQRATYSADRVFEILPALFEKVARRRRSTTVIVEADTDPCLRHAHPYDHRLFILPEPGEVHGVFRRPEEASRALMEVMEDTSAFAAEIFGLFDGASWDDDEGVRHEKRIRTPAGIEERIEVSEQHVRRFVLSPLGAEIASRIQLRPEYHGMIESDVVVVNTAIGSRTPAGEECFRRIATLIRRVRDDARPEDILFRCEPRNEAAAGRGALLNRLRSLLAAR